MRVNLRLHRIRDEERGAVLMIVALLLLALMGMLVLVFDLGRVVAIRRDQVNAADAAALAAAQQCAKGHTFAEASAAADTLNTDNSSGAAISFFDAPQCTGDTSALTSGSKFVTVDSTVNVEYFFAQIFGLDSGPVTTRAVAQWGPVQSLTSPVPIRINLGALTPCILQTPGSSGAACAFAFDDDPNSSQWGILNFPEGWPADGVGPPDCNGAGGQSDVNNYLTGTGTAFTASVPTDPGYVYVCAQSGARSDTMTVIMNEIAAAAPDPFYMTFPVMSDTVPILDVGGNQEAVPIIGFTVLRALGAWFGQDAKDHCTFPDGVNNSSLFCIQTQWDGGQVISGGIPGPGQNFGPQAIRLVG
jgi:Flp pilus assembly protein TadG